MEATQLFINRLDKQNAAHTSNGMLLGLRKEGSFNMYYNMDDSWEHLLSEISHSQKDKQFDSNYMSY